MKLLPIYLIIFILIPAYAFSQEDNSWLAGTWHGSGDVPRGAYSTHIIRTLEVTLGPRNTYTCITTNAVNDKLGTMSKVKTTGEFYNNKFHNKTYEIVYRKDPPKAKWSDCKDCPEETEIIIEGSRLVIRYLTHDCHTWCNGSGFYYKELTSFNLATQRYLYERFGSYAQNQKFKSTHPAYTDQHPQSNPKPTYQPPVKTNTTPAIKQSTPLPLTTRENQSLRTYNINTHEITLELFDNATEDGDSVSVYDNNQLIVNQLEVKHEHKTIKIFINSYNKTHVITLVANNLGRIPPNTAVLLVKTGTITEQLQVRLTLEKNATITFNYTGN